MDSQGLPLTKSSQERQVRIQLLKQALAAECRRALLVKQAGLGDWMWNHSFGALGTYGAATPWGDEGDVAYAKRMGGEGANGAIDKLWERLKGAGGDTVNWMKDNPGMTALGIGGAGLGAWGLSKLFSGGGQEEQASQPSFAQPAFNQPKSQYRQSFFG